MRHAFLLLLPLLTWIGAASADDREKTLKQLNRITALAADVTGRRVVSMSVADSVQAARSDLVRQRRTLNLSYGGLFLVLQLTGAGVPFENIVARVRAGQSIADVADDFHADWSRILKESKRLNRVVEKNLFDHFVDAGVEKAREASDHYNVFVDLAKADFAISENDLAAARDTYLRLREMAQRRAGHSTTLDIVDERNAYRDHINDKALTPPQLGGTHSPPR